MLFDGAESGCIVVAEVGQNHDGSLGTAHAYIDAVARTGADAIKFQTHIAAAESTPDEPWRVKFSLQDTSRYDYWKRMEFTAEQWCGLADHAMRKGLAFLSSPFSLEAVELLERVGVPAWKIGAGEVTNIPLLERVARTRKPVMLSSGMSMWVELDEAAGCVRGFGAPLVILQCTSMYPCPPEKIGLNVLEQLRERYHCPVGLSDHSGTIYAGLAAVALGAAVIEVHVTFSNECFGPDVPASITTSELGQLIEGVRFIEKALQSPVDKNRAADELSAMRAIFGKSIVAARDLPIGSILCEQDVLARKPANGILVSRLKEFIHRPIKRAVSANHRFSEEDFE